MGEDQTFEVDAKEDPTGKLGESAKVVEVAADPNDNAIDLLKPKEELVKKEIKNETSADLNIVMPLVSLVLT